MKQMIATKPFTYNTRRLQAGDVFEVRDRDEKLLLAVKKAKSGGDRIPGTIQPPPAELVKKAAVAGLVPPPVPPATQTVEFAVAADHGASETGAVAEQVTAASIPDDWRDLPWTPREKGAPSLQGLAISVSETPIKNKADAVAAVEAELARRASAALQS